MNRSFVTRYVFLEATDIIQLSRFQKWICRVFKITPEKLFNYRIQLFVEDALWYCPGDIIVSENGFKWLVLEYNNDNSITVKNLVPCKVESFTGYIAVAARTFEEGTHNPRNFSKYERTSGNTRS